MLCLLIRRNFHQKNWRRKYLLGAWEQRKLGDVFEQTVEYIDPKEAGLDLWSVTVENGLTPKSERYNREFLVKKNDKFKAIHPNEIVYNPMNMTLGSVGFNNSGKDVAISGYYVTMKLKEEFDSNYFATWLPSPKAIGLYKLYATGSLIERQRVQFPTLSAIKTAMPSLEEQKKIGEFFKHLDNTITLHQRKIEQLKLLKQAFLQKMLANQENVPELRFADFDEVWVQRKVSDLSDDTYGGGTPSTNNSVFWKGEIPWIQSSDISMNTLFKTRPKRFITEEAIEKSAAKIIPANSITIVTRVGVGKIALISHEFSTSQDFLSLANLKVDPLFGLYSLYKMLQSELNKTQGTSIKGITKTDLLDKQLIIPTILIEQEKIGILFKQFNDTIELHQKKWFSLKKLKTAFLQSMFISK